MSKANAAEQYMLELINAERAKVGVQPLAFDGDLNESSEDHSSWMLSSNIFSHTGAGGSNPGDRMEIAGYDFSGNWTWGENIAWKSFNGTVNIQNEVQQLHTNLMNSPGHRANLLKGDFREIGVGVETGQFESFNAAMVTQNFARTASDFFLTGVAFNDQDNDNSYDVGEGFGNVTVSAKNNATGAIVTTTTNVGGGYDLELVNGTYTVRFSGSEFATIALQANINNKNVKLDLVDPSTTGGTSAPEPHLNKMIGTSRSDFLQGTSGNDEIQGLRGDDILHGAEGNDHINGGRGSDLIFGGTDADILTGGTGRDYFVFDTPIDNTVDTIVDFSTRDYIVLDNAIFAGLNTGRLDPSSFYIGAEAKNASNHIIYNSETGALYYDSDAAGRTGAQQFAELTPGFVLSNTDFYVI